MKVSSTELPPRQVSLDIEVEQERLDQAVEDAYRRLAGRVDVPGFRRGKAPRPMVERMIGRDRIVDEALDHLIPEVVSQAIEQEKLEAWTRPRVESIEFDPLRLKAVVGLAPKVDLRDYRAALKVASEEPRVGDEEVERVIQRLRDSYAQWAPVDRAVRIGDRVGLDLKAIVSGSESAFLDSKEAEYIVDPEGAQPAPGFAEQVVGMSAGQSRAFTLTMPDDYRDTEIAGQPAEFSVTLHWIKERELPALDDDFARQVGDYDTMAALRSAVKEQVRQREEERVREKVEQDALAKLVEIASIEFPPQLVDTQAQHMRESVQRDIERQGLQLERYLRLMGKDRDTFDQEIRSEAETRIRQSLALDAFADAENITSASEESDSRERRALARLVEIATGDQRDGNEPPTPENSADRAETSDTERQASEAASPATTVAEEGRAQ